ncbi:DNA repair protein rhp7 isoform X1 [Iris pallida]|uniref:DNA repair protein rhp7 isoform X1 n=1 Tax=Iris pallida TaxID=29817 RepID=A0AAX6ET62_IRIPA|nr:DNA repair protein rhp7 isoform X1 [Iris pallida]
MTTSDVATADDCPPRRRSLRLAAAAASPASASPASASSESRRGKRKSASRVPAGTGSTNLRFGDKKARSLDEEKAKEEGVSEEELYSVAWPDEKLDSDPAAPDERVEESTETSPPPPTAKRNMQSRTRVVTRSPDDSDEPKEREEDDYRATDLDEEDADVSRRPTAMSLRSGTKVGGTRSPGEDKGKGKGKCDVTKVEDQKPGSEPAPDGRVEESTETSQPPTTKRNMRARTRVVIGSPGGSDEPKGGEEEEDDRASVGGKEKGKEKLVIEEDANVSKRSTPMNLRSCAKFRDTRSPGGDKGKGKCNVIEAEDAEERELEDAVMMDAANGNNLVLDWTKVELPNKLGEGEGSARPKARRTVSARQTRASRRAADRNRAVDLAPKFALFAADKKDGSDDDEEDDEQEGLGNEGDWPGPFSTAMKLIREREEKRIARESNSSASKKDDAVIDANIKWVPSNCRNGKALGKPAPSLRDLCMKVLCENAEEIESLEGVPDVLKHRLMSMLCQSRKMGSQIFNVLVSGLPTEIQLGDCSWATEEQFQGALGGCNTDKLKVVQLDLCGRCMPDYVLRASLAQSPNSLPSLTSISLKGDYRLTDDGLNAIVASAPSLSSINLSQCSLITSGGIIALADKLEKTLRELYINECQNLDPMTILSALVKLKALEVLSMSGIETVNDKFVKKLISERGSNFKELSFADCRKLTAASMKVIGEKCSGLRALDLSNLNRLTDPAICHLGNGCRSIQKIKLRRNKFSDEAIAAFVEAAGGSLTELSFNNVGKVGQHTALAISRRCSSTLNSLDLSFCREMTNEALGLIVDSCLNLRILKLFGCTQVTNVFLEGHSNSLLKIVGLKGPILEQLETPYFL